MEQSIRSVSLGVEGFQAVIGHIPTAVGILVGIYLIKTGIMAWQDPGLNDKTIWEKLRIAFWSNWWGANALQGQLFILGAGIVFVFHVCIWWGVPTPPELNALITIAALVLTAGPPAYEHDALTEKWPKWFLTFGGMINAAAFLGSTLADIQLCSVSHDAECQGPSVLQGVISIIAISLAALVSSRLSRKSRWGDLLEMHPPLDLIHALKRLNQLRLPSLRDNVVELFLSLEGQKAADLLQSYAEYYKGVAEQAVLKRAVEKTRVFFEQDHEDYPHVHELPEEEEEIATT